MPEILNFSYMPKKQEFIIYDNYNNIKSYNSIDIIEYYLSKDFKNQMFLIKKAISSKNLFDYLIENNIELTKEFKNHILEVSSHNILKLLKNEIFVSSKLMAIDNGIICAIPIIMIYNKYFVKNDTFLFFKKKFIGHIFQPNTPNWD